MRAAALFAFIWTLSAVSAQANEGQAWAKSTGALIGMATACGYDVNSEWMNNVIQHNVLLSEHPADAATNQELMLDYIERGSLMQKTNPNMTCGQVIQMMRDSEEAWGGR